jgi:hypothetical protein
MILKRGGSFQIHLETGAFIHSQRNAISAAFLNSGADLLLMLDSDQWVGPETIQRMIDFGKPFTGCFYPRRQFNWSNVRLEGVESVEQLIDQALGYVGTLKVAENGVVDLIDGFAPATQVGTGILLLHREVFARLEETFPQLKGIGFTVEEYPFLAHSERWGFFNPVILDSGLPLSEDLSFCHRWTHIGGEIWATVTDRTMHIGQQIFLGSFLDHLKASEGGPR